MQFSHPLIAESPSPDTKIRLDYIYKDIDSEGEKAREDGFRLETEYAFQRSFSVEIDVPYVYLKPDGEESRSNLDNIELAFKFANFEFEDYGVLLGYGIEFGLPTGNESKGIGSDHIFSLAPFLSLGYKTGKFEIIASTEFEIPTNQEEGEEIETELGYNLALLYSISKRLQGGLELDGESVLSGEEPGKSVVNLTPEIKLKPFKNPHLELGLGVSFPISKNEEFKTRVIGSAFYHF